MTLLQALLIALFGYLSSNYSPWCFGQLGGWYTMGRPLVSGLIIGVILGDVRTGILMGAAVQTLYIGLVTPGLSMPADLNFAAYMGIPLAMVAGASTEQGKIKKATNAPVYASISQFAARFVPIFLACYFGQDFIISVVQAIPAWLGDTFVIFGKMLPAVGFAMLLRFVLGKNAELVYFFVGFIMIAVLKMPIVAATLIACFLAYLDIRYTAKKTNEVEVEVDE